MLIQSVASGTPALHNISWSRDARKQMWVDCQATVITYTGWVDSAQSYTQYSWLRQLDTQNLQTVIVADCYPVWLRWWPLYLVYLSSSSVRQYWILDGTRHLLDVPDQRLPIISCKVNKLSSQKLTADHIFLPLIIKKLQNVHKKSQQTRLRVINSRQFSSSRQIPRLFQVFLTKAWH